MDSQTFVNILMALVAFLGGWMINSLREGVKDSRIACEQLAGKVQGIEVMVAGSYVKRDDLDKLTAALFAKLDKIELKLDGKADRAHEGR